jgi:hypothetical protein
MMKNCSKNFRIRVNDENKKHIIKLQKYINTLEIRDKNIIYYNIDNYLNIQEIFNVPNELNIPNILAHLFFDIAIEHDTNNIMKYINFFKNRNVKFCWHHLQYKSCWENSEEIRRKINNELLKDLPPFNYSVGNNSGDSCICDDTRDGSVYSLTEALCIDVKPINVNYNPEGDENKYLESFNCVDMDIDDLIDWNVPFIDNEDSNYPISCFSSLIELSYKNNISNDKLDKIIKKVESRII